MVSNQAAGPAARSTSSQIIPTSSLNSRDFAAFGQVIQDPARGNNAKLEKVVANQGTATKWLDVTDMTNHYDLAPSKTPAKSVMNLFVCKPRKLEERGGRKVFDVRILERHPYTPQTFIPLGISAEDSQSRYLVIVAPTLRTTEGGDNDRSKPSSTELASNWMNLQKRFLEVGTKMFLNDDDATTTPDETTVLGTDLRPKGPGQPDLDNLRAFIAKGDQAVTYGPGTWHAPMVALGDKDIDFVVVQYANGVGTEDCQEVNVGQELYVDVTSDVATASAPGIMRANL